MVKAANRQAIFGWMSSIGIVIYYGSCALRRIDTWKPTSQRLDFLRNDHSTCYRASAQAFRKPDSKATENLEYSPSTEYELDQ